MNTSIALANILLGLMTSCLAQTNTLYDVISALPVTPPLHVEETVPVPVRLQCSLYCQQRSWCRYFAVCSTTSCMKDCHLLKISTSPPVPPFVTSGCTVYKEKSETPVVCNGGRVTAGSACTVPGPQTPDPQNSDPPSSQPSAIDNTNECGDGHIVSSFQDCSSFYGDCSMTPSDSDVHIYTVKPSDYDGSPFQVPCYRGMILIQRRHFCSVGFFNRSWSEYEEGFGDMSHCFWLGNAKIHALTSTGSELSLNVKVTYSNTHYSPEFALYTPFKVDTADNQYKLDYGNLIDTNIDTSRKDGFGAPDISGSYDLDGKEFYTSDRDSKNKCATKTGSGWWFNDDCAMGNLNHAEGPKWLNLYGQLTTYYSSEMALETYAYSGPYPKFAG